MLNYKSYILYVITIPILLFLNTKLLAQGLNLEQAGINSKIEEARHIFNSLIESGEYLGLSAAISYKGKVVFADGFGYKNKETKTIPDENTMFRIYSISKPITGLLALKLVEEGKLDLEQPIGDIIPSLPQHLHSITSKQLLAHTAGVRHYNGYEEWDRISQYSCKSPMDALGIFTDDQLKFNPGDKVSYSSFGYVLLSAIIEKAGGNLFTDQMDQKIFIPSNAKRITLDSSQEAQPNNMTAFYIKEEGNFIEARQIDNSCKFGGGGYNASAKSVAKIWTAYMTKELLNEKMYDLSIKQVTPNNGEKIYTGHIGIGTNKIDGLQFSVSNGGALGGRSTIFMYPDNEIAVVIIGNSSGKKLREEAQKVADLFLEN